MYERWSRTYLKNGEIVTEEISVDEVYGGLRLDFKAALNEFIEDFAKDPGISWDEAIEVLEAKIAEMRAELRRNA